MKESSFFYSALGKVVLMADMFHSCMMILQYNFTFYGVTFNLLNVIAYGVIAVLLCKFIFGFLN